MFSQSQKPQSNLFASSTLNPTTSDSMFGQTTTGSSILNPNTSSNLFSSNLTQPNMMSNPSFFKQPESSSSNLFSSSNKPLASSSSSMFPAGNLFSNMQLQRPPTGNNFPYNSSLGAPSTGNIYQMTNKKEMDKQEINQIISNYTYAISMLSPTNHFMLMVYNRIDPKRQNYIRAEQEFKPRQRTIDGKEEIFVDYNLWNTALQRNPNNSLYYPFQLNCPKNLLTRALITQSMQRYAFEYIIDYQKKINYCRQIYDVEIQNTLGICKKKLSNIKKSQVSVISKLEKLAIYTKRAEKEYNLESNLVQKFNQIKSLLVENDNIVQNIEDISSKTSFINQFSKKDTEKVNLNKDKFQKNMLYFKELKNVFDTTFETLNNDFGVLSFIKNELDNSKKYGINSY